LNKLELAADVGTDEGKHQPAVRAIIFEDTRWERWAIGGSSTYHSMDSYQACDISIPRVQAADVRA